MNKHLVRFAAITAFAYVLSRLLGLVRDQVIAGQFGLGYQFDAYVLALQIPDLLFILVSGGILSSAFIPKFVQLRKSGKEEAAWCMASGMLGSIGAAVSMLIVVTWVLAPVLVRYGFARDAPPQTQALTIGLMRVVLLQPLFLSLAGILTAIQQAFDRFTLPAFAPIAYNACIILGALVLAPRIGMYGVAIGVVVGSFVFLMIQLPTAARLGLGVPRSWPLADSNVRSTFALLAPRILGQGAEQINGLVAFYLASSLGSDRVSAFRLAWTLFILPVGLFASSVGTVTFPALSREHGESGFSNFRYLLRRAIRGVLFFVLPASIGLVVLREPIISLIYERGKFTHYDTVLTAQPLLFTSLGMWAYALIEILPRAFYALHDTKTPVKITLLVVVIDAVLMFILVKPMGLQGLALAFVLATFVHLTLLIWALQKKIGVVLDKELLGFLARTVIATSVMAMAIWLASPLVANYSSMTLLVKVMRVGLAVAGGMAIYIATSIALKQEEVATMLRLVRRRA